MKIIKVIMAFVLLTLVGSVFIYLNNGDGGNVVNDDPAASKQVALNEEINQEHKIKQDDKDNVVETNLFLLKKLSDLSDKIKALAEKQKKQKTEIEESKLEVKNNSGDGSNAIVAKVMSLLNNKKANKKNYKINGSGNSDNSAQGLKYTWSEALRSGFFDEDDNFVEHIATGTEQGSLNGAEQEKPDISDSGLIIDDKATLRPVYTIPNNSILSAKLITGLIGRIPLDGQVTDPFRFSIKIANKSIYANRHENNVLQDVIASGTASGDLQLSCVRATIDSITFIFEDGTISDHKISEIGFITNEYGVPCIKGELITDAAQYLSTTSLLSGLSSYAKAIAEAQKTVTSNTDGSASSSVTGSPLKLAAYSASSGAADGAKDWFDKRTKSSFDVIFVPSGGLVKILTQEQINIDYDPNGRKLDHQLATGEWSNEILD